MAGKTGREVLRSLESSIIRGELRIGESLRSERQLAEEFGVSKTVIHEVLSDLREKNLITSRARSTNTVADWVSDANFETYRALLENSIDAPTLAAARDFAEFRIFNEGKCAALAAQRRTGEDMVLFNSCLESLGKASKQEEFAHEIIRFHHLIFRASGNRLYAVMFGSFVPLLEKWSYFLFPDWKSYDDASLRRILSAIERHDAVSAECTMTAYITRGAGRIEEMENILIAGK